MVRHLIRHTTYATMDGRTWFKGIIILSINNSMTFTLRITDINQSDLRAYFIDKDLSAFYVIGVTERGTNGEDHYHCVIQLHGYKLNSLIKDLKRKGIISTGNKSYATKELKETDITSYSQSVKYACKNGLFASNHPTYTQDWITDNPYIYTKKKTKDEAFLSQISRDFEIWLKEEWPIPAQTPDVRTCTIWIVKYHHDKRIFDKFIVTRFYDYLISRYVSLDTIVDKYVNYLTN